MTNEHSVLSAAQVDELLLESQRLRTEVERLEAERITYHIDGEKVTAEVFNVKFQSMKVEIERLEAENTKLKEAWDALPRSEAVDQLIASRAEVERLEADVARLGVQLHDQGTGRASYYKGVEAAAMVFENVGESLFDRIVIQRRIRAAAKDTTTHRDDGDAKETT